MTGGKTAAQVRSGDSISLLARDWTKRVAIALLTLSALLFAAYWGTLYYLSYVMKDAASFEEEIEAFEAFDVAAPPSTGKVLFVGSSSIRLWDSLEQDMAPIRVLNRGFGGSMIHHSLHYADRIIVKYDPSAIVYYGGSNDIGNLVAPRSPSQVSSDWAELVALIRQELGDIPIFYISIKPTELRSRQWDEMTEANTLIFEQSRSDPNLHFIDIANHMLDEAGEVGSEYFIWDGLHMNDRGYALWARIIRHELSEKLD
ncbi:GDSL-type esterase/lipase family protein [Erythrobacter sp.]|uniref:GDSL-type esterase/lipase family protein n=1 Tax=Sphingomonadales TaxID=204457 RepID=UPI00326625F0